MTVFTSHVGSPVDGSEQPKRSSSTASSPRPSSRPRPWLAACVGARAWPRASDPRAIGLVVERLSRRERDGSCYGLALPLFLSFLSFFFMSLSGRAASSSFGLSLNILENSGQTTRVSSRSCYLFNMTRLFRLASLPMLPIFRIIMLPELTVELIEILSVLMFRRRNSPFLPFRPPSASVAIVSPVMVASVPASDTSLCIAALWYVTNGALGARSSCGPRGAGGVTGGVPDRVDVSDGEV